MNHRLRAWGLCLAAPLGLALALLWMAGCYGAGSAAPSSDPYSTYYVAPSADCGGQTPCFASLQAAVDAADAPDDIIKVAGGVYTDIHVRNGITQVVYISKTVLLYGGYAPGNWTTPYPQEYPSRLDARGRGRVMTIAGSIQPQVAGFDITGGDAHGLPGGFGSQGGGLYVLNASAHLEANRIFDNQAADGGGLYLDHSPSQVLNNTIFSNTATRSGGGGLYLYWSNAALLQNAILSNTASLGGGLLVDISDITLEANLLRANVGTTHGGGLYFWYSHSTLSNNILAANQGGLGSGMYVTGGSQLNVFHATLADNGGPAGSGIVLNAIGSLSSTVAMTNTILTGHFQGIVLLSPQTTATLEATLWGNQVDWSSSGTLLTGTVNVWGNPAFIAPGQGNYHISPASAAVDAGVPSRLSLDIDLDPRPTGNGYDLGADETWVGVYLPLLRRSP